MKLFNKSTHQIICILIFCVRTMNTQKLKGAKIIDGKLANWNDYSFMAFLFYISQPGAIKKCGGSLISPKWILTAAHCIPPESYKKVYAILGHPQIGLSGPNAKRYLSMAREIDLKIIQEEYKQSPTTINDIGLLRLQNSISLNKYISTIQLFDQHLAYGTMCKVAGWGWIGGTRKPTGSGNFEIKDQIVDEMKNLREAEVMVSSYEKCERDHWFSSDDIKKIVWTKKYSPEKQFYGPALGDSGGPLVYNGKLAGITSIWLSKMYKPCDRFTSVKYFIPWIKRKMDYYEYTLSPRGGNKGRSINSFRILLFVPIILLLKFLLLLNCY